MAEKNNNLGIQPLNFKLHFQRNWGPQQWKHLLFGMCQSYQLREEMCICVYPGGSAHKSEWQRLGILMFRDGAVEGALSPKNKIFNFY